MMTKSMCWLHRIASALVTIGALNWGLVGALEFNLVNTLLGDWMWVERAVYILVGLAGIAMIFACKCCVKDK